MDVVDRSTQPPLTHSSLEALYGKKLTRAIGSHKIACISEVSPEALGLVDKIGPPRVSSEVLKKYRAVFGDTFIHAARCTTRSNRPVIALLTTYRGEEVVWTIYKTSNPLLLADHPDYFNDYDFTISSGSDSRMLTKLVLKKLIIIAVKTAVKYLETADAGQAHKKRKEEGYTVAR